MERRVKASTNTLAGEMGLAKSVGCDHGDGMDQLAPAPATSPVAHVGLLLSDRAQKRELNIPVILVYICLIYFFRRLK